MANKTYTEVLDTMIPWTDEYRAQFQQRVRFEGHRASCGVAGEHMLLEDPISYPTVQKEFVPDDKCSRLE